MELSMSRRKKYDKEYKLTAIKSYEESGKLQREYEAELGIGAGCISHWMRELKEEKENVFPGNGNPRDEEMARLRRENEILRQERDILKKVVGIFSKTPL